MTRARRVSEGERTHSERVLPTDLGPPTMGDHDDEQRLDDAYSTELRVGGPRLIPERMCKRCETLAEPDTVYGVILAPSGLGHYWPEEGRTLCGADTTASWTVT